MANMKNKTQREYQYKLIDGNWAYNPVAYCKYRRGGLTEKLMKTHKCKERNCPKLEENIEVD